MVTVDIWDYELDRTTLCTSDKSWITFIQYFSSPKILGLLRVMWRGVGSGVWLTGMKDQTLRMRDQRGGIRGSESPGSGIRGVGSGIRVPRIRDQRGGIRVEGWSGIRSPRIRYQMVGISHQRGGGEIRSHGTMIRKEYNRAKLGSVMKKGRAFTPWQFNPTSQYMVSIM